MTEKSAVEWRRNSRFLQFAEASVINKFCPSLFRQKDKVIYFNVLRGNNVVGSFNSTEGGKQLICRMLT